MPPRGIEGAALEEDELNLVWKASGELKGEVIIGGGRVGAGLTQSACANFVILDVPSIQKMGSQLVFVEMNVSDSHLSVS